MFLYILITNNKGRYGQALWDDSQSGGMAVGVYIGLAAGNTTLLSIHLYRERRVKIEEIGRRGRRRRERERCLR